MKKPSAVSIAQLHRAAEDNSITEIRAWVAKHGVENIDARDDQYQRTALICAAANKREGAVRLLLDMGANPNAVAINGHAPLILAAINDSAGIINALLDKGADIELKCGNCTALAEAVNFGNDAATETLLKRGAHVGEPVEKQGSPSLSVLSHALTDTVTAAVMQENTKRVGAEAQRLGTEGLPAPVQTLKKIQLKPKA